MVARSTDVNVTGLTAANAVISVTDLVAVAQLVG